MRTIILILCVFLVSCETNKTQQIHPLYPGYEYLVYHNYSESDPIYFDKKVFNGLKKISFNDFHNVINQNTDISNLNRISLKNNDLFYRNNDSFIDVYILGEINDSNIQQYLGFSKLNFYSGDVERFIIFNIVDNKIQSSFIVYSSFDTGFGYETRMVTFKGDNNYELMVSGWADAGGKFEHLNCFKITEEGFIDTSVECKKGSKK